MIGVDPHKTSHTAPMMTEASASCDELKVRAGRRPG